MIQCRSHLFSSATDIQTALGDLVGRVMKSVLPTLQQRGTADSSTSCRGLYMEYQSPLSEEEPDARWSATTGLGVLESG